MDVNSNNPPSSYFNRPDIFKRLISEKDYAWLINITLDYFKQKKIVVKTIEDGLIKADSGKNKDEDMQFGLDNLIKKISQLNKKYWKKTVFEHFDKLLRNHQSAYTYLFKDFEYAAQFLKVIIKDYQFMDSIVLERLVFRIDFPKTHTFLILDFEDQFRYLMRDDIKEWGVSDEDLFAIALNNIAKEKVAIDNDESEGDPWVYFFTELNFAAAFLIDLPHNAPFAIGNFGSMVAIPCKGIGIVHPINELAIFDAIKSILPIVTKFHNEQEGGINPFFYWYYDGQYEEFPIIETTGGNARIYLPKKLDTLLRDHLEK